MGINSCISQDLSLFNDSLKMFTAVGREDLLYWSVLQQI